MNYIFGVISNHRLLRLLQQRVHTLQSYHGPLLALRLDGVVEEGDGLVEGESGEHGGEDSLADPGNLLVVAGGEDDQLPVDGGGEVREAGEALTVLQGHLDRGQPGEVLTHRRVVLQEGQDLSAMCSVRRGTRLTTHPPHLQFNVLFSALGGVIFMFGVLGPV